MVSQVWSLYQSYNARKIPLALRIQWQSLSKELHFALNLFLTIYELWNFTILADTFMYFIHFGKKFKSRTEAAVRTRPGRHVLVWTQEDFRSYKMLFVWTQVWTPSSLSQLPCKKSHRHWKYNDRDKGLRFALYLFLMIYGLWIYAILQASLTYFIHFGKKFQWGNRSSRANQANMV